MKNEILRNLEELKVIIGEGDVIDILDAYIKDTIIAKNQALSSKDDSYINITEEFLGEDFPEIIIEFLNKEVENIYAKEYQLKSTKSPVEMLGRAINYYLNNEIQGSKIDMLINSGLSVSGFRISIPTNIISSILSLDNVLIKALKNHANVDLDINLSTLDKLVENYTSGKVLKCFTESEDNRFIDEALEKTIEDYLGKDATFNLYQLSNITIAKFLGISAEFLETRGITREAVSISLSFKVFSNIFLIENS